MCIVHAHAQNKKSRKLFDFGNAMSEMKIDSFGWSRGWRILFEFSAHFLWFSLNWISCGDSCKCTESTHAKTKQNKKTISTSERVLNRVDDRNNSNETPIPRVVTSNCSNTQSHITCACVEYTPHTIVHASDKTSRLVHSSYYAYYYFYSNYYRFAYFALSHAETKVCVCVGQATQSVVFQFFVALVRPMWSTTQFWNSSQTERVVLPVLRTFAYVCWYLPNKRREKRRQKRNWTYQRDAWIQTNGTTRIQSISFINSIVNGNDYQSFWFVFFERKH